MVGVCKEAGWVRRRLHVITRAMEATAACGRADTTWAMPLPPRGCAHLCQADFLVDNAEAAHEPPCARQAHDKEDLRGNGGRA